MGRIALVLSLFLASAAAGRANVSPGLPERKSFQFGEFTIEAAAGDEPYVEALAVRLPDLRMPPPAPLPALKLSLADLAQRRDEVLGRVAAWLGLPKPTAVMASTFDARLKESKAITLVPPTEMPRHYAIWRRSDLVARLAAGESVPGFHLDASGGPVFEFGSSRSDLPSDRGVAQLDLSAGFTAAWRGMVWPVKIDAVTGSAANEDIEAALGLLQELAATWPRDAMAGSMRAIVLDVIRETADSGVTWGFLTSKDRRWFCEGVAGFVAYKVLESEVGADEARGYFDLRNELRAHQDLAPRVDLAGWPPAEDAERSGIPAELDAANRAYAIKVVTDLCARRGDDFLPKLFREIGRTKREKATMATVYHACRKLAGEDLRAALRFGGADH